MKNYCVLKKLREISRLVESFNLDRKKELLESIRIADIGDIKVNEMDDIFRKTSEIVASKKIPLLLSTDHLATLYAIGAFFENTKIVIFDAHCDFKDNYIDDIVISNSIINEKNRNVLSRFNGATWLRRFCEVGNPKLVCLVGVRACSEEEINSLKKNGILYFSSCRINRNEGIKKELQEFLKGSDVYVSLDIDVFDPSIAPAVYYPEPNGIFFDKFSSLIGVMDKRVVGIDLCLHKILPENSVTEFLAVKSLFEIISKCKV
ncbi:MAG: arginase family protein [Candidatus Nanoarchaeia archaeon]